jgi:hypothetical protein
LDHGTYLDLLQPGGRQRGTGVGIAGWIDHAGVAKRGRARRRGPVPGSEIEGEEQSRMRGSAASGTVTGRATLWLADLVASATPCA